MDNLSKIREEMIKRALPLISSTCLSLAVYLLVIYFTLTFEAEISLFKAIILTSLSCCIVSVSIIAVIISRTTNKKYFRSTDYAISAVFIAIFSSSIWWGMLLPSFVYLVVPFATALTFYLPESLIFGAYTRLVPKPGSSLLLFLGYCFISEMIYPNAFWIPYYLAWGAFLEIYFAITGEFCSSRLSRLTGGFLFGVAGAGLCMVYMLVGWRFYRPLFLSIPAITIDGLFSTVGTYLGSKIGDKAKSISVT